MGTKNEYPLFVNNKVVQNQSLAIDFDYIINKVKELYMLSSEDIRKLIFMDYKEILSDFNAREMRTKGDNQITHTDLRKAVCVMQKKHSLCRWQSERIRKRYYYIQYEGVLWLRDVYFNLYDMRFIDKDIKWFENRIIWYQSQFNKNNIDYTEFKFNINTMNKIQLCQYFDRSISTIENALRRYEATIVSKNRYYENGKLKVGEDAIIWLTKNQFKDKYIELLESYKMELTEIFKVNGGHYDDFFGRN